MSSNEHILTMPEGLHPQTQKLVVSFATEMAKKLRAAELKYGYSDDWRQQTARWPEPECREGMLQHIQKGDPLDVAIFCSFLWYHGLKTF